MRILSLVLLLVSSVAFAQEKEIPVKDYSGFYEARGQDGTAQYAGLAILKRVEKTDRYVAQWTSAIGQNITGIGFIRDGYLVFSWVSGNTIGITEYKIGEKGFHKGRWTHSKTDKWFEESIKYKMDLFKAPVEDEPITYSFDAPDETYKVTLSKERVTFVSENWLGKGEFKDGKYRVSWFMEGELICMSWYQRSGNNLSGIYWYLSDHDFDREDSYEESKISSATN